MQDSYETKECTISLDEIIGYSLDDFLDLIAERAFGSELLIDINYDIIRAEGQELVMKVSGDTSQIEEMNEL